MKDGAISILPLAIGVGLYGFAFGILAAQTGYPWWAVAVMSVSIYAGAAQIVAVERFAADGLVIGAAIAGVALNLRYLGIIASVSGMFAPMPRWIQLIAIHLSSDENWALSIAKNITEPRPGTMFLIGSGLTMLSFWVVSTVLGAALGAVIPDLASYGLGFAFTAAFIAMARAMWRGTHQLAPWAISFLAALSLVQIGMESAYAIVIASIIGVALAAWMRAHRTPPQPPEGRDDA